MFLFMPLSTPFKNQKLLARSRDRSGGWSLLVEVEGRQFVREPDGVWRYADRAAAVPGARDLTATERYDPQFVGRGGVKGPEQILLPTKLVTEHDDLAWCLKVGSTLRAEQPGSPSYVMVPASEWAKHEHEPVGIVAPELSLRPAVREIAEAERDVREAQESLAAATRRRAQLLTKHGHELTRREVADITGLSLARVQQLVADTAAEPELRDSQIELLRALAEGTATRGRLDRIGTNVDRRLRELRAAGLVGYKKATGSWFITDEGRRRITRVGRR
jgi:hypothetical protein